ncbi:MAG: hypothetical protein LBJ14_01365 [Desulfarculales bacterium]|jgi:hypothetical protein|nr:hypothetical protein [Desulfarculales bacterium]
MIKKLNGLLFLALLLGLSACASTSPLQQLQGTWLFSFDESAAENPQIQEAINNDPEWAADLRRYMENTGIMIDTDKSTITALGVEDEEDRVVNFTVVSETPEDNTLVLSVGYEEFILTVSGQRLLWISKGDSETMVFTRKP